jgi:hypothetical protein
MLFDGCLLLNVYIGTDRELIWGIYGVTVLKIPAVSGVFGVSFEGMGAVRESVLDSITMPGKGKCSRWSEWIFLLKIVSFT